MISAPTKLTTTLSTLGPVNIKTIQLVLTSPRRVITIGGPYVS